MSDIIEEKSSEIEQIEEKKPEERPFLVAHCMIDGNTQRELMKPLLIYSRIGFAVGVPLLLAYIVLYVLCEEDVLSFPTGVLYLMLFVGAILLGTGIVFLLSAKKNIKNVDNISQMNEYSFFDDYVSVESIRRGERLGASKAYYVDFVKIKESKKYFLLYPTTETVFPVPKEGLSEEELGHLRNALRLIRK